MEKDKLLEVIKMAILLELRGEAFYKKVAESTDNPDIKNIFTIMAKEEILHVKVLRDKYAEITGKIKEPLANLTSGRDESASNYVLSESMKDQIAAAGFEAAAIAAAIDMESKAVELYSESAENAKDPEVESLFRWLADWEKGHYKLLYDLDKELKERIWNDNQFWPF